MERRNNDPEKVNDEIKENNFELLKRLKQENTELFANINLEKSNNIEDLNNTGHLTDVDDKESNTISHENGKKITQHLLQKRCCVIRKLTMRVK